MLRRECIMLLLAIISNLPVSAQYNLDLLFEDESFDTFSLSIYKGANLDTLYIGQLDMNGYAHLSIPDTVLSGVGNLNFNNGQKLSIILNKENFKVEFNDPNINSLFVNYIGSAENTSIKEYFFRDKLDIDSMLYAFKLVKILKFLSMDTTRWDNGYLRNEAQNLDWKAVYTSGLWIETVNKWVEIYFKLSSYDLFIRDALLSIAEIEENEVKLDLINTFLEICELNGWGDIEAKLVENIYLSQSIVNAQGKILGKMRNIGILPGDYAPDFMFDNGCRLSDISSDNNMLLVFYDSSCDHCQTAIDGLIRNYDSLNLKNINIGSIAIDQDSTSYQSYKKHFPWQNHVQDKLMRIVAKYGVMSVPSFLLIEYGVLTKRTQKCDDIISVIK